MIAIAITLPFTTAIDHHPTVLTPAPTLVKSNLAALVELALADGSPRVAVVAGFTAGITAHIGGKLPFGSAAERDRMVWRRSSRGRQVWVG
jgi:hypothetical protein